jgi:phage portal protein BeeE
VGRAAPSSRGMATLAARLKAAITRFMLGPKAGRPLVYALPLRSYSPARSARGILEAYETDGWFQAVVDTVAAPVADGLLAARVYKPVATSSRAMPSYRVKALGTEKRRQVLRLATKAGEWVELPDHEMMRLLARPHPDYPGRSYMHLLVVYFVLCGEAFLWLNLGADGRPLGFTLLPPTAVAMTPMAGSPWFYTSYNGRAERVPAEAMVWLKKLRPSDPEGRGVGRGAANADELDTMEAISNATRATFQRGGVAAAVVSVGTKSEDIDAEEQKKELEKQYKEEHQGVDQAGKVWFVAGDVSLAQVQVNFRELQTEEIKRGLMDYVRTTLNVPAEMMGVQSGSTRATSEEAKYTLADRSTAPWLFLLVDALNHHLLSRLDTEAVLEADDPRPASWERMFKAMTSAPNEGVSWNEYRVHAMGLEPDPELEGKRPRPLPGAQPVLDEAGEPRNTPPPRGPAADAASEAA